MNKPAPGKTFADLGIPFPLYEALTDFSGDYFGIGRCTVCHRDAQHCFDIDYLMLVCPSCGEPVGLLAQERESVTCLRCETGVAFPEAVQPDDNGQVSLCYDCLRAGRGAFGKDTELGMVNWEQAANGVTFGIPWAPKDADFRDDEGNIIPEKVPPTVVEDGMERVLMTIEPIEIGYQEETWYGARVRSEWLWELLRTPNFISWQGEYWLFCCQRPMIYIGDWEREDFTRHAPDGDGLAYFRQLTGEEGNRASRLWQDICPTGVATYVFHCPTCGNRRAYFDRT